MSAPSRFCDKCKAIQFNDAELGGYAALDDQGRNILKFDEDDRRRSLKIQLDIEDTYPKFPFLSKSAADGCDCCRMLKNSVRKAFKHYEISIKAGEERFRLSVEYVWGQYDEQKGLNYLVVNADIVQGDGEFQTIARYGYTKEVEPKGMTSKTVSWIKSSLNSCQQCENLSHDQFIPTRLLQVDSGSLRLVEMDESTILSIGLENIKYVTLSYCWGPPDEAALQIKTEKLSLEKRLRQIDESEMKDVFRDAIAVCRALSMPFLWVDALCIVQDDLQDWQRESSLMGRIYSNAQFTICATSSKSCTDGFLDNRVALTVPFRSYINPRIEGTFNFTPAMSKESAHANNPIARYFLFDYFHSPLVERGWVLQERFMSEKMLMFGGTRLHIVCSHKLQTQGENTSGREEVYRWWYPQSQRHQILSDVYYPDEIYRIWYQMIVSEYSSCKLTYMTDRFPAISGLVRLFNERLRDEYVAGLWKGHSYRQKLSQTWSVLFNQLINPTTHVAPSWSWVSRGYYVNDIYKIALEHGSITPHVTLAGMDPYGQLSSAELQVTTQVSDIPGDIILEKDLYNPKNMPSHGYGYVGSRSAPYTRCGLDWAQGPDGQPLERLPPNGLMLMLLGESHVCVSRMSESLVVAEMNPWLYEEEKDNVVEVYVGLIIYSIPNTTNFLRVGTFESLKEMRIFDGCEPTTVNLI